eukprot:8573677-Lingulodinium_polyedra.AAC.1
MEVHRLGEAVARACASSAAAARAVASQKRPEGLREFTEQWVDSIGIRKDFRVRDLRVAIVGRFGDLPLDVLRGEAAHVRALLEQRHAAASTSGLSQSSALLYLVPSARTFSFFE